MSRQTMYNALSTSAVVVGALMALSNTGLAVAEQSPVNHAHSSTPVSPLHTAATSPSFSSSPTLSHSSPLFSFHIASVHSNSTLESSPHSYPMRSHHTESQRHTSGHHHSESGRLSTRTMEATTTTQVSAVTTTATTQTTLTNSPTGDTISSTATLDARAPTHISGHIEYSPSSMIGDNPHDHKAKPRDHARLARRQRPRPARPMPSVTPVGTSRQNSTSAYNLVDSYEGSTFFDGWDFFEYADPTHGMIRYVSADEAKSSNLAYVRDDGVAVMTVDTTTTLAVSDSEQRNSVRITTKKSYGQGLFIFDILKAPHGCSTWPAAWLVGPDWPSGGEIDVVEGVHENVYNQMTVHASAGCQLDATKSLAGGVTLRADQNPLEMFTGTVLETDCDATINSNAGCGIMDYDTTSYGAGLNDAGGGVYATLWDNVGVRIWFFKREDVPADITGSTPDPTTWGTPRAYWAASSCASSFFNNLSIVFDIVLGGDWAGATYSAAGCPGTIQDYVANPSNFANANWAVNSVRVYQTS
ncbi:Probable glycosidase C21B10.07 [Serendipita indica DSM 11827]|nr:Probable glycosidase C21B10.07 [Serendipita indica DSM 11827]